MNYNKNNHLGKMEIHKKGVLFTLIDYGFKKVVIDNGFCAIAKDMSKAFYYLSNGITTKQKLKYNSVEIIQSHLNFINKVHGYKFMNEAFKINHAQFKRGSLLSKKIQIMLSLGVCVFLTLTFNDKTLASTDASTRKRYITRFLKSQSDYYIANIDFGKQNGREHYHAVILCDSVKLDDWNNKHGAINAKKVSRTSDNKKLAKYIAKLTNHAIKATTKRNAIIYSRKPLPITKNYKNEKE